MAGLPPDGPEDLADRRAAAGTQIEAEGIAANQEVANGGKMRFGRYLVASVLGGIVWTDGILLLGHALGHIDWVRSHKNWIDYAVVVVVILGLVPTVVHYFTGRRRHRSPSGD